PYHSEDNPYTLLNQADLVFIDPVGTGYSRAAKPEYGARFWGLDEDVRAVGEFIRLYLVRNQRWSSPLFLSGESYGTTRAAHLARLAGLSSTFIDQSDLRVRLARFNRELLRDRRLSLARFDSRFTAYSLDPAAERGALDPSEAALRNAFTPVLNDYVRRELNYKNESVYYILGGGTGQWNWTSLATQRQQSFPGFTDVTPSL